MTIRPPHRSGVATHQLRRRWTGIGAVLVITVFTAGVVAALAVRMKEHEAVLDVRGRQTAATVLSSADGVTRRLPDTADVRYEVEGRAHEARLPVADSRDFPVGSRIQVVYDPDNPRHAKPTEGWSPSFSKVSMVAGVILGFGVFDSGRRTLRTLLLLRTARRPRQTTMMRAESFSVRHWWQRWPRQWVALWPLDADPLIDDVQLFVPIEELDTRSGLQIHASSLVLGTPEPKRLLVIIQGDNVVWPRGWAQRDEPGGAIPDFS